MSLLAHGLKPLIENIPDEVNVWNYMPSNDRKSSYGYCGIYNLHSVCYMNAMLQQFYMTPAFRYAMLNANDYQEDNIIEVNNKQIDDNLFHQIQRMFAY